MPDSEESNKQKKDFTSSKPKAAPKAGAKVQKAPVKKAKVAKKKKVPASRRKKVVKSKGTPVAKKPKVKAKVKSKPKEKPAGKEADKDKKDEKLDKEEEEEVEIIEEEEEEEDEEGQVYEVKLKPKLSKSDRNLLKIRKERKSHEPTFRRQEWFRYKRLGDSYRKPRGLHSKMRKNVKYRPKMARIGYGTPAAVRGRHPSGFEEVMVHRPSDLEGLDPKKQAVRIGHQVGTRKRIAIEDKADELGIRILNRGSA